MRLTDQATVQIVSPTRALFDQVTVAQVFRHQDESAWATPRDSVVLYAQNYKGILKNAAFLAFIVWGLTPVLLPIVAALLAAIVAFASRPRWSIRLP